MPRRAVGLACLLAEVASASAGTPDREELDQLLADTDALAAKVVAVRGLALKREVKRGLVAREQVEERVLARLAAEQDAGGLADEARAWKRLGLLPADADYKKLVIALVTEQVAGFYDPTVGELYIADWIDAASQRPVLIHEIDHALVDQHFGIDRLTRPAGATADAVLAREALVEGDGLAAMVEVLALEAGQKDDPWIDDHIADEAAASSAGAYPEFERAPLLLRERLLFPYVGGLRFLGAVRRYNAWKRVDEIYKKPPASTEQVLHPEKYFGNDKPVTIRAGALPSLKKWKTVHADVMGELVWSVFFRQHGVADRRARDAAEGWGGDRFAVLAPPDDDGADLGKLVVVSVSAWDEEMDAIEAFEAAAEAVEALCGVEGKADGKETVVFTDAAGATSWVSRKGSRLAVVIGAPAEAAKKLRGEVWAKWK